MQVHLPFIFYPVRCWRTTQGTLSLLEKWITMYLQILSDSTGQRKHASCAFSMASARPEEKNRFPHLAIASSHFVIQALMSWWVMSITEGHMWLWSMPANSNNGCLSTSYSEVMWISIDRHLWKVPKQNCKLSAGISKGTEAVRVYKFEAEWLGLTIYFEKFRPFCLFV